MTVSKKAAVVAVGSIGALNVKTTEAEGETPIAPRAGVTLLMITWAEAWLRKPRVTKRAKKKQRGKIERVFIVRGSGPDTD